MPVAPLLLALVLLAACGGGAPPASGDAAGGSPHAAAADDRAATAEAPRAGAALDPEQPLTRIALGSCNRTTLPQPLWDPIVAADPDLWIWLGDNVYGDTNDMAVMREKYDAQVAMPGYTDLRRTAAVIGTWDDHDFGENNAGNEYPMRAESQQEALDFLGVPEDDPRRRREGLYSSHVWGPEGSRVKVILLDSRYHRDERGSDGAVLSEEQWAWLERELTDSDAQVHLIGNGIQILHEDHRYEKWSNFPSERRRLLDLIASTGAPGVVLLSGDRHLSELARLEDAALPYPLWEMTSSGMTHSFTGGAGEPNRYRVGDLFTDRGFGLIELDWEGRALVLEIRGIDGAAAVRERIPLESIGSG
jgi:alkaline phosphatase D